MNILINVITLLFIFVVCLLLFLLVFFLPVLLSLMAEIYIQVNVHPDKIATLSGSLAY